MTIFFALIAAALALLLQRLSARRGLQGIQGECRLSSSMAEPEETFFILISLTNRSRRFIPFLRYQLYLPQGIRVLQEKGVSPLVQGGLRLTGTTWLGPRQRFEKRVPVSVPARGRYILQDLTVSRGDFLGLREYSATFGWGDEIVVPPKPAPRQELDAFFGGFLGEVSVNRFLFEDPVLTLGFREYTGREPMKMISWTQSARGAGLMVKKYDYTLEPSVCVILNGDGPGRVSPGIMEECFSLTRTVCRALEDRGIKYSFRTNLQIAGGMDTWYWVREGLGQRHFRGILEGLGRATCTASFSCRRLVEQAAGGRDAGQGIIFITPGSDPAPARDAGWLADVLGSALWVVSPGRERQ
jgi:hypothetical protein